MIKKNSFKAKGLIKKITRKPIGYIDLIIEHKSIPFNSYAGQFVMLKSWDSNDPLLPRPFDIVQIFPQASTFRLIVKIAGKGTALMDSLKPGDTVSIAGPLGKPIKDYNFSSMVMLIRGCGAAAVVLFAEQAYKHGIKIHTILSASTKNKLMCVKELQAVSESLLTATDDGSSGYKGLGTKLLKKFLKQNKVERVYSCGGGPFYLPYLKQLQENKNIPVYLFLESYMACGRGHCHGCAVKHKNYDKYYLVCQD